jgi:hypothetical protein
LFRTNLALLRHHTRSTCHYNPRIPVEKLDWPQSFRRP